MTQGILLDRRVDLEKLTQDDFKISGELRVTDEPYQGYRLKPEFKLTETDTYVPLDQLFPESKFHECYQLILQTPDHTEFLGSGYLHRPEARPVSFGTRDTLREQILEKRVYLKLHPRLAPYKAAVFPLLKNKPELMEKARGVYQDLLKSFPTAWDERGNIGKRYYAQDEIGTPYCITVDFQTLDDDTVTIRDRDTAEQERIPIPIGEIEDFLEEKLRR